VPRKKPNSSYDRDGNFDIELYVIRETRKSKVPAKVKDARVLNLVAQSIKRLPPKPKKA
jgi:hypothetical protein